MLPSPSTSPVDLGWPTVCLTSPDLPAMLAFYGALGFEVVGGDPDHGYAVLGSGPIALTPMGFLQADLLNFRGGDIPHLAATLAERGLSPVHGSSFDPTDPALEPGPRRYDASAWPPAFHTGPDGAPLPTEDAGDFLVSDPDGALLYFDSVPVERARFRAGERFATEAMKGDQPGQPDLGRFVPEIGVGDLAASRAFWERLGLRVEGDHRLATVTRTPFQVLLRAGASGVRLVFEGADLPAIREALARHDLALGLDGDDPHAIRDPAGHVLCFR